MNLRTWIKSLQDQERSFLDAITDDPLDATNYLVFADWLGEHGRENEETYYRSAGEFASRAIELSDCCLDTLLTVPPSQLNEIQVDMIRFDVRWMLYNHVDVSVGSHDIERIMSAATARAMHARGIGL